MRLPALIGWLMALGTGCTVHVVEGPATPVMTAREPMPVWYREPARPVEVARPEPARPARTEPVKAPARPRPARHAPLASSDPKPLRPARTSIKPSEARPSPVTTKPKPAKPPVRTVRDAGSQRPVAQPSRPVRHEHDQHARAHEMQR